MAKKDKPAVKRAPTAGEVAKWQKQERRNRIVFVFGVVVIVAVLALLGYGYYDRVYKPDHAEANKLQKTIVQVNEKKFNLRYVIDEMQFLNALQAKNNTNDVASLKTYSLNDTVQVIEYNQLLEQAAPGLGISITEDELWTQIKSMIKSSITSDASTDLTEDQFVDIYKDILKTNHISDEAFRDWVTGNMLQPKLQDYLKTQVPKSAEQIHMEGVLVNKSQVTEVADRLVFTGDSLDDVAKQVSLLSGASSNGADMGWMTKGILGTKFDDTVFNIESGVLSQPIDDETGQYPNDAWMIAVSEKASDRELDSNLIQSLTNVNYSKWFKDKLQEGLDSKQVVNKLDDNIRIWATNYISEHYKTTTSTSS